MQNNSKHSLLIKFTKNLKIWEEFHIEMIGYEKKVSLIIRKILTNDFTKPREILVCYLLCAIKVKPEIYFVNHLIKENKITQLQVFLDRNIYFKIVSFMFWDVLQNIWFNARYTHHEKKNYDREPLVVFTNLDKKLK